MGGIQYDGSVRIVAWANLKALCKRASGTCHRFTLEKPKNPKVGAFVRVWYSNPDEYGNERPFCRLYPIVAMGPKAFGGSTSDDPMDTALIGIGSMLAGRTVREPKNWDGEGWQAFHPIEYGPELFREGWEGPWRTREEIEGFKGDNNSRAECGRTSPSIRTMGTV